jgi:hypothetical protein
MRVESIVVRARSLGICLSESGGRIQYRPKSLAPPDFVEQLRQHKEALIEYLKMPSAQPESWITLPFPLGCRGLPEAQVEAAEAVNDSLGITDPVHCKYNILTWVIGHYQDLGKTQGDFYHAIKQEQQRLGQYLED